MKGNIYAEKITLHARRDELLQLESLKNLGEDLVKHSGFTFRRFSVENYRTPKNAYTLVCFLDESHLILTTYPEHDLLEVELTSCKLPRMPLYSFLVPCNEDWTPITMTRLVKDSSNNWNVLCS